MLALLVGTYFCSASYVEKVHIVSLLSVNVSLPGNDTLSVLGRLGCSLTRCALFLQQQRGEQRQWRKHKHQQQQCSEQRQQQFKHQQVRLPACWLTCARQLALVHVTFCVALFSNLPATRYSELIFTRNAFWPEVWCGVNLSDLLSMWEQQQRWMMEAQGMADGVHCRVSF